MNDDESLLPVEAAKKPVVWQPGQSGNPAGRPKGAKNRITLMKAQVEAGLRDSMKDRMQSVVDEMFRQALPSKFTDKNGEEQMLPGDGEMLKALFKAWITPAIARDEEPTKEKIHITIGKLDSPSPPLIGKTYVNKPKES